jgi:hypothetical protein
MQQRLYEMYHKKIKPGKDRHFGDINTFVRRLQIYLFLPFSLPFCRF